MWAFGQLREMLEMREIEAILLFFFRLYLKQLVFFRNGDKLGWFVLFLGGEVIAGGIDGYFVFPMKEIFGNHFIPRALCLGA